MSRSYPRGARLVLALALMLGALVLIPSPGAASEPAPTQSTARFEVRFMENMIDHHMMAVMMAEICVERAAHEDLRAMCAEITASQSAEIEQMQSWLADRYGITYEPRMTPGMMRHMEKMAAMDAAEFEIEFMEMMIRHHTKAIHEAEKCVDRAFHDELVSLCENIIATQSAEIEQMRTWLCDWYGICREGVSW